METLKGKQILIGVSSSVSLYKVCNLISLLRKAGATVRVLPTEEATEFIRPKLFEALTHQPCPVDLFAEEASAEITHITWAQWADLFILAPATAHLIAQASCALASDRLTTTLLAYPQEKPVLVAPAMNQEMWRNPRTQAHCERLRTVGWTFVGPVSGTLACGDVGPGKLAEPEDIFATVQTLLQEPVSDYTGQTVLVTAGPTREPIDPVRFLSNRSTGKMGYALAEAAAARGAEVYLLSGPVALDCPMGVHRIWFETAEELKDLVLQYFSQTDLLIMAAAVADFTPAVRREHKWKKEAGETQLALRSTPDILQLVSSRKQANQQVCGFAMETQDLLERGRGKRIAKKLDWICCNSLVEPGAGFGTDTNHLYLIGPDGREEELPLQSKRVLADRILDRLLETKHHENC